MTYEPPSGPNEQPLTLPKDSEGLAINEDLKRHRP